MKILRYYLLSIKKYKWWLIMMIISILIVNLVHLFFPIFLRQLTNLFVGSSEENYSKVIVVFKWFMVLWIIDYSFSRIFWFAVVKFQSLCMHDIANRCFKAIQKHSYRFFTNNFTGSLVKKVSRFTYAFEAIVDNIFFNFLKNILQISFIMVIFFIERPIFGFLFLIWTIIFLLGNYFFALWKLKFDKLSAKADSKVSATLADSFSNYATVKIFAGEKKEQQKFKTITDDWLKKTQYTWLLSYTKSCTNQKTLI